MPTHNEETQALPAHELEGMTMVNSVDRPTLKSVTGAVGYTSSDGYSSKTTYGSRATKSDPVETLMSIIYEAVRVASLFGHGDDAVAEAESARKAVAEHLSRHHL